MTTTTSAHHGPLIRHFLRLNGYESWANTRVIDSLESVPAERRSGAVYERLAGLLPHNQLARQVWLWRLMSRTHEHPKDWFPQRTPADLRVECARLDREWSDFLNGLTDRDLVATIQYRSSAGVAFSSVVHDVLTHVFNHSTYHRGQIARLVHECGGQRADTDFIGFSRLPGV